MNGNNNNKETTMNARDINDARIQIALLNDEHNQLKRIDVTDIREDASEVATRLAEIRSELKRLRKLVA